MTTETAPATSEKMLNNRDLMRMYWRSTFLLGSFNFERMQAMGFCYTLMPAIRKVYRGDKAAEAAALKRHLEFYNTHPWASSVIFGVTAAMEEQKSKGEDIGEDAITNVKIGLMGPVAGIGDPSSGGPLAPSWRPWGRRWLSTVLSWGRCCSSWASTFCVFSPAGTV